MICVSWAKGPYNVVLYAVTLGMRIICDIFLNCVKAVERHLKLDSDHLCLSTPDVRIWSFNGFVEQKFHLEFL